MKNEEANALAVLAGIILAVIIIVVEFLITT